MALSRRQKITIFILIFYWIVFFILAHMSVPGFVRKAGVSDKALHFLVYLVLFFLLWFAVRPNEKVSWHRFVTWLVFIIITGYGAVDELVQSYVGRNCDVLDIVANTAGALTGLIICSVFSFWPAMVLIAGVFIFGITNIARVNLSEFIPVVNILFHLFAYPVFTVLWIRYMYCSLSIKPPTPKWPIVAFAVPIALLFVVKTFSLILGKNVALPEVIISIVGILIVVMVHYLIMFFRKTGEVEDKGEI